MVVEELMARSCWRKGNERFGVRSKACSSHVHLSGPSWSLRLSTSFSIGSMGGFVVHLVGAFGL
jgi:hypothetical protein